LVFPPSPLGGFFFLLLAFVVYNILYYNIKKAGKEIWE